LADPLLPWAPFFYSFGPSLFIIKILADWLKVRLYYPLNPSSDIFSETRTGVSNRAQAGARFERMTYQQLRKYLEAGYRLERPRRSRSRPQHDLEFVTPTGDRYRAEVVFASKAETRYHIHHFLIGFPLSFVSWACFVYGQPYWGLIAAGIVAALFLSELKELVTQRWEP
jgi:hypothetical protein